jgi:hypothetical protein
VREPLLVVHCHISSSRRVISSDRTDEEDVMFKNLMYVTVYVSDQDRALAFYTEALGLEKRVDYSGPEGRFLTVAPGDESVEIILWPGNPGQRPAFNAAETGIVPVPSTDFLV